MSDNTNFGFAKLVPGFDFLQSLAKGASLPQLPNLSSWIAPTLNVEELDKRIQELKAVHFWLDQNGKALSATIQALEVQKMTLATLQGMNFSMGEVANALKLKPVEKAAAAVHKPAATADIATAVKGAGEAPKSKASRGNGDAGGGGAPVDPLQWWGALTQQFQEIAVNAMKDVAQKASVETAKSAKSAVPAAAKPARKAARKGAARKSAGKRAPAS